MNRAYPYTYKYTGYSMPKQHGLLDKYPQDIQCVYPSADPTKGAIYVSNVEAASNFNTLSKFNIRAVMTCAKGYDRDIPKSKLDMFQYFPFDDKQTCMISPFFESASDFIAKALSKTNILVHCIAGVSRSVSMVLAYLIRDKGMSYQDAYKTIKSRRSIISPNDGFIKQLKQYAAQIRQRMNRQGSRTPIKQRLTKNEQYDKLSYTPTKTHHDQHQLKYKTTIRKSENFYSKSNINNEEDQQSPKRKTDDWIKFQNNHSQTFSFRNDGGKQKNQDFQMTKSSTFINYDRPKTPEKVLSKQHDKKYPQTSVRPRSAYFEQMNKQLNQKIQAIHAKYEKQREALLLKRGLGAATLINQNTKAERSFSSNLINKESRKGSDRQGIDYFRNGLVGTENMSKYANIYDSKYTRGLGYNFGRTTANSNAYYRNRYYL